MCQARCVLTPPPLLPPPSSLLPPLSLQVSGHDGSQWSSPPLSHSSELTFNSEGSGSLVTDASNPHHNHHHLMVPSQNESGFCDNDSDFTGSSLKQLNSPYSTGVGTCSSDNSHYSVTKVLELPPMFQPPIARSASVEACDRDEPAEVLEKLKSQQPRRLPRHRYPTSLSQETYHSDYTGHHHGYYLPGTMSLSQSGHGPLRMYHLSDNYYRKPGSPASSSDTNSLVSSVVHRIGSGPASEVSFTTSSSRSSSKGLLPRPSTLSSGSSTSVLSQKPMYSGLPPEVSGPSSQSEIGMYPHYSQGMRRHRGHHYDSDEQDESLSTPVLPSMKQILSTSLPKHSPIPSSHGLPTNHTAKVHRRKPRKKPDQPRIPEEGSQRDSFPEKLEMVLSMLSVVSTDTDAAKILLALSQSSETCNVMRQSACMNMLIQIMHNIDHKGDVTHREVRMKAAEAMRNIIESSGETRQGKHELCVLNILEKIRSHCDMLFELVSSLPNGRRLDAATVESLQSTCDTFLQPVRKLYKYSNDKEHYRPAILSLGGLQATAEVLIVNHKLISAQKGNRSTDKLLCHTSKIITVVISVLINLTYGDVNSKSLLCTFPNFMKALMFHLRQQNQSIIASGAQVLRNLSWRATADIKDALLKCDASVTLVGAIDYAKDEPTVQHITSALWNLSAHSVDSRHKISSTSFGIQKLVNLLSYNSPSGSTAVVENVGGILKNLSVVIMQEEDYRSKFREAGGLAKLVQHLKSKNKTVLANATGILWNLSARCPEDQKLLWNLGCIPLLDVLQTSHQKNISENARGALRNLLAFGQTSGWTSKSDVTSYNIKTQRGLSKSLSYAAAYALSQDPPHHIKHSNESLHSRRSQPLSVGKNGSTSSLNQSKFEVTETKRHREEIHRGYPHRNGDSDDEEDTRKPRFARVGSAPVDKDDREWNSYVPGSYITSSKQSTTSAAQPTFYPEEVKHKRTPKSSRSRGNRGIPHSLSQSESYHLSSNSELPPAFSLSPHLSSEPASLSAALPSNLDSKLDGFDPNQPGAFRAQEEYADLEVEDDENEEIDHPEGNLPNHLPSSALSAFRRPGTSNLALDGTTSNENISDSESMRQHNSKIISDV